MAVQWPQCQSENPEDSSFCRKCGSRLPLGGEVVFSKTMTLDTATKVLAAGSVFAGKYKILGELGHGGMGIVYKAEDIKLKRPVALKFLPAELARYDEAKGRFLREAQAAAALEHPNICTIYEAGEADGLTYIAMAFVEGRTLREQIARHPLESNEAVEIAAQIAEGLKEAHEKGIVHRDIKSANIMITEKGQAKIMDFGLAKMAGGPMITAEAKTMGTVAYMSPEQARGEEVDRRTDLWSLGVVFYEMLTGRLPFQGERETSILYTIVHEEPKPLRQLDAHIPIEIQKMCDRALKKNKDERYASGTDMLRDLRAYQDFLKAAEAGVFNLRSKETLAWLDKYLGPPAR